MGKEPSFRRTPSGTSSESRLLPSPKRKSSISAGWVAVLVVTLAMGALTLVRRPDSDAATSAAGESQRESNAGQCCWSSTFLSKPRSLCPHAELEAGSKAHGHLQQQGGLTALAKSDGTAGAAVAAASWQRQEQPREQQQPPPSQRYHMLITDGGGVYSQWQVRPASPACLPACLACRACVRSLQATLAFQQ